MTTLSDARIRAPSYVRLAFVLGDQLHPRNPALGEAEDTTILMAEVAGEAERHPNHRHRLALFFSAMRHWADERRSEGYDVRYVRIDEEGGPSTLAGALASTIEAVRPDVVAVVEPGRVGLAAEIRSVCGRAGVRLRVVHDDHFVCSTADFREWADGRTRFVMEHFYRWQRRRTGVLMNGSEPAEGQWNYDAENRDAFGADGPGTTKAPVRFVPDDVTRDVLAMVGQQFPDHPGAADAFDLPVTHAEAMRAVRDFVEHRLPDFGTYQDAMWAGRPYLYHARISAALNLKLVSPRYVVDKAEEAYRNGHAPIQAVEGFVRQVIGWREYMRGLYYLDPSAYLGADGDGVNALGARRDLPSFYWSGETHMACMADVVDQLKKTAYAHHIQRLMVAGLFALLYGVKPMDVHDWFMAYYADSVEWVTLPNVVGMSQYADGGYTATKPYVATGRYIDRQSNYCGSCRYRPDRATGDDACPFTTLYWSFLHRHADRFRSHRRMGLQVRNLDRKDNDELTAIADREAWVRRAALDGRI